MILWHALDQQRRLPETLSRGQCRDGQGQHLASAENEVMHER